MEGFGAYHRVDGSLLRESPSIAYIVTREQRLEPVFGRLVGRFHGFASLARDFGSIIATGRFGLLKHAGTEWS